jgi:exopolysaccharide biosynthesis polyprenyl glycosylphosphotransferase
MLRQFSTKRVIGFFLIDWIGSQAMLYLAALLRAELGHLPQWLIDLIQRLEIPEGGHWVDWATVDTFDILSPYVFILVALIWPFFAWVFSIYDGRRNGTLKEELLNVLLTICVSTMTLSGALYFTYRETPRVVFLIFFALDLLLLLGSRVMLWLHRRTLSRQRADQRAVLIVGAGAVGQNAVRELQKYDWADIELVGYVDDDPEKQDQRLEGLPVLGTLERIPDIVEKYDIQNAVLALPLRAHKRLVRISKVLQDLSVSVHVIPDLFALSFPNASLEGFGGIPVIDLGQLGLSGQQRFFKRMFDTVAVTLALIVLSPLLVLVAILIKLDSPGPVLYRQQRIGEHGQPFTMLKFRSMRTDADPAMHKAHVTRLIKENVDLVEANGEGNGSLKMEDDPRITRVGKIIRKTSIDELPQLFNVLRGEMSLVGPRPPLPYEVELYEDWHKRRLEAPPGITGWWQVKGRNRVSFDEMVRMDINYIEQASFWFDLKILFLTPRAVLSGQGAG